MRGIGFALCMMALLAGPSLCLAGFIAHPCDCPEGTMCSHEAACSFDPCADGALRESSANRFLLGPDLIAAPEFELAIGLEPNWLQSTVRSVSIGWVLRRTPGLELPLLI